MVLLVFTLLIFAIVSFEFPNYKIPGYLKLTGGIGLVMCWAFLGSVIVGLGQMIGLSNYFAAGIFRELFQILEPVYDGKKLEGEQEPPWFQKLVTKLLEA